MTSKPILRYPEAEAALRIGVPQSVMVVRFGQDEGKKDEKHKKDLEPPLALINPEIIKAGQPATGFDGCLSIPGLLTWGTVRPSVVTFKALNVEGKPIRRTVKGIDARLLHHEVDHLDGLLFLDRLDSPDDLFIVKEGEDGKPYLVPFSKKPPREPGTLDLDELKL